MRLILIFISLLCLPFVHNAQTLKGKVYDAEATVKGIKVTNETQKRVTATDNEGNFTIEAKVSDTLLFESLFHHPKAVILTQTHFEDTTVFESGAYRGGNFAPQTATGRESVDAAIETNALNWAEVSRAEDR